MSDSAAPTKTVSDFEAKLAEADKAVASFARDDKTLIPRLRSYLRTYPTLTPTLVLLLSVIIFGLIAKNFFAASTLSKIVEQGTLTAFIALAQTLIILTAGIDLSVGAILVIATLVMGNLAVNLGFPVWVAVPVGVLAGGVLGCLNGVLVAFLRLPPFIVTLGTMSIFNALKKWYSGSQSIRALDVEEKAENLIFFGHDFKFLGATVTLGGIALVVTAVLMWYILQHTAWGRHVHAVGDDPEAAKLSGIRVERLLVSVYAVAGLICGFTAWIAIGRLGGTISPTNFETINLASITAVVIGGTSLFGGRGSIVGSVLGALIVQVFVMGLSLSGVDSYWQEFATGSLVIIAVALDQWLRRASQ
jgi:fructose transport system permease protein